MKLVVAIVRPERLNAVLEELFKADVQGLTISRVDGHGGERQQVETFRGTTVKMELSDKVRLEIGVSDDFVDRTVQAILRSAQTGQVGDGKIFVMPVEKIYRIRTGEQDESAVTPRQRLRVIGRTKVRPCVLSSDLTSDVALRLASTSCPHRYIFLSIATFTPSRGSAPKICCSFS